jgi:phosphohistidine phosphatase
MLDCPTPEIDAAAMRLLLLRHAKSEKAEPGMADRERRLNARGQSDAATMGGYIARHGLAPDLAVVSTAQRTRETWERVAAALSMPPAPIYEERLYNAGRDAILTVTRQVGGIAHTLLVIGHNPGLHDLARTLIASGDVEWRERLNEGLPTAGLVVIEFAGENWRKLHAHGGRLERFVTPRSLAAADRV